MKFFIFLYQPQDKINLEVDKLLELMADSEKHLSNLPSDSLEEMLSSLQVSIITVLKLI